VTSLLPSNSTAFERAEEATSARLLATDADIIRRARDPAQCSGEILPLLGWERSVHRWSGDAARNREAVASSFIDHLSYGSAMALESEISADVGTAVKIREAHEAGLTWPRFQVAVEVVSDVIPPAPSAVLASAMRRKNVRDVPVIQYTARQAGSLGVAAQMCVLGSIRIMPVDPTPRLPAHQAVAASLRIFARYTVRPFS